MTIKEVKNYYDNLSEDIKIMIDTIMFSTMNVCSELINEPLFFKNEKDYNNFRETMLYHLLNSECYDYDSKTWVKINSPIPQLSEYILN